MPAEAGAAEVPSAAPATRRVLHCDMDCFYAAVHLRDDPSLAGRPVVVGGRPEGRGVVAAASYEARRYGVHSAMPASRAVRLCPHLVILPPDFRRYQRESEQIFAIYRELTPIVQAVSIDEAYLDVTDHLGAFGTATRVAREIRRRVREERGLTVSVGVGPNRLVAKIASDFHKPDGLTVVPPERVQVFLDPLPVRRLHGVGPATERLLLEMGIQTVADLRARELPVLQEQFGRLNARLLYSHARGIDERPVAEIRERKSLGTETTYERDLVGGDVLDAELGTLAIHLARTLERCELATCTVVLKVRYGDFTTLTRSQTFADPLCAADEIAQCAQQLLRRTAALERPVRLLGITASRLVPARFGQLGLFSAS
jgi:DNA polymerase-4